MHITAIITFIVATLSGLGVGSAGLLVVWLTLAQNMPQIAAQGQNLIFFILSSGAALTVHLWGTPPLWETLLFLIPSGVIGSLLGTALTTVLPQAVLRRAFGVMLIISGSTGLSASLKKRKKS
ncbi:MAG: sulfite exporter TauE/SafE family protein [Clostridia bacterium]|nr:sulfite exporter TauE/SafE family protein [Clostridia bacterium]